MPEPPKITTSLAERIAKLNSTQGPSKSSQGSNLPSSSSSLGPIRTKISRYEASGANEAPLIPKGSFGLGAPLTKPERGLDRIRIASLGVSGGEQPKLLLNAVLAPASPGLRHPPVGRSVSLGGKPSSHDVSETGLGVSHSHGDLPTGDLAQLSLNETSGEDKPDSSAPFREPKTSSEGSEAYDGILEGYPVTPAEGEESNAPMVSCIDCSELVDLELLAEHVCQPNQAPKGAQTKHEGENLHLMCESDDDPASLQADVPVDAIGDVHNELVSHPQHSPRSSSFTGGLDSPNSPSDSSNLVMPSPSTPALEAHPACSQPSTTTLSNETRLTGESSSERGVTLCTQQPANARLGEIQDLDHRLSSSSSSTISTTTTVSQASVSTESSSFSSNTTNLDEVSNSISKQTLPPPASGVPVKSPRKTSWYDDDDDEVVEGTGYVTIVRCSQRF